LYRVAADRRGVGDHEHHMGGSSWLQGDAEPEASVRSSVANLAAVAIQRGNPWIAPEHAGRMPDIADLQLEVRVPGRVVGWLPEPDSAVHGRARARRLVGGRAGGRNRT